MVPTYNTILTYPATRTSKTCFFLSFLFLLLIGKYMLQRETVQVRLVIPTSIKPMISKEGKIIKNIRRFSLQVLEVKS